MLYFSIFITKSILEDSQSASQNPSQQTNEADFHKFYAALKIQGSHNKGYLLQLVEIMSLFNVHIHLNMPMMLCVQVGYHLKFERNISDCLSELGIDGSSQKFSILTKTDASKNVSTSPFAMLYVLRSPLRNKNRSSVKSDKK